MAQQETPNSDAESQSSALEGILGTADHKTIGRLYVVASLLTLIATGLTPGATYYVTAMSRSYATTGNYRVSVDADLIVPETPT